MKKNLKILWASELQQSISKRKRVFGKCKKNRKDTKPFFECEAVSGRIMNCMDRYLDIKC